MVRNYKNKEKPYKEIDIFRAQELVEKGASIRDAARQCGVPRETLRRWVSDPPSHSGSGSKTACVIER